MVKKKFLGELKKIMKMFQIKWYLFENIFKKNVFVVCVFFFFFCFFLFFFFKLYLPIMLVFFFFFFFFLR